MCSCNNPPPPPTRYGVLDSMRHPEAAGLTRENFRGNLEGYLESFTCQSSDGREVELCPGGASTPVTWDNRIEWAAKVEHYRLHESEAQVAAIRSGMAAILPAQLLPLFTWRELELLVCGKREIDIVFLQQHTNYRGCKRDDPHVRNMWTMLEAFTHPERELFLRFVWGRTRLPLRTADFTQKCVTIEK